VDKNQLRINIRIEGRVYPLNIDRKDEEKHRIAAKTVNETVQKYRELFRDKDAQDILAMAAFQIALNQAEMQERQDRSLFIDELKNLNDDISDFLKEKKKK
jgi:cell division protein ZapA